MSVYRKQIYEAIRRSDTAGSIVIVVFIVLRARNCSDCQFSASLPVARTRLMCSRKDYDAPHIFYVAYWLADGRMLTTGRRRHACITWFAVVMVHIIYWEAIKIR